MARHAMAAPLSALLFGILAGCASAPVEQATLAPAPPMVAPETWQLVNNDIWTSSRTAADEAEGYARATALLEQYRDSLSRLAEALLEYETLDAWEIEALIKGQPLAKTKPAPSDSDSEGRVREKTPGHATLPQLINRKGKPAPA